MFAFIDAVYTKTTVSKCLDFFLALKKKKYKSKRPVVKCVWVFNMVGADC